MRLPFLLAVVTLVGAVPGAAQEAARTTTDAGSAQEPDSATYALEDLVVTAHRVAVPRGKTPVRVTVLRGAELEARGIRFVADALRDVPGAAVVESGPFGSVASLFLRGGESDYVRVLVDGVAVNDPGGSLDLAHLTTDAVERIEVLRGPGSVLYGSDAMTGVVHVITKRGRGPLAGRAGFRAGTYGTLAWEGGASGGGEAHDFALQLSRFASDGLYDFNNEYRNTSAAGRLAARPDGRTEAAVHLRYADARYRFPTDGAGEPTDANQYTDRRTLTVAAELARDLLPRLRARLRLAAHDARTAFDDRPDGPGDTLGFYAFQSQQDVDRRTADLRADYRLGPATVFTAGGELEEERFRSLSRSESEFGADAGASEASRWNVAAYGQAVVDIADALTLSAGLRADENERFGSAVTGRAGAAYRLPTGTRVRASWGTGFKEPTFFEQFAEGFARGNPDLEPERSRSLEAGADQSLFGGRLALAATWFDQRFRDLIQFTFAPAAEGDPNYFNVAAAEARGLELEAEVRPLPGLFVEGSWTHLKTEVTDAGFDEGPDADFVEGDRLLRRPANVVSARAGWRAEGRASVTVGVRRVGERVDRDFSGFPAARVTLPAYTTVDLALELGPIPVGAALPRVSPTLRIENLFDEEYEEIANFPARGRTAFVGLRAAIGS